MSAWVILLFLLCGGNTSCGCSRNDGMNRRSRDCGCDRDSGFDKDRDCDYNESRFEPRFDARPFSERETCGCEENND